MISQQVVERVARGIHEGDIKILSEDVVCVSGCAYDTMLEVISGIDAIVVEEGNSFLIEAQDIGTTLKGWLEKYHLAFRVD